MTSNLSRFPACERVRRVAGGAAAARASPSIRTLAEPSKGRRRRAKARLEPCTLRGNAAQTPTLAAVAPRPSHMSDAEHAAETAGTTAVRPPFV